MNYRAESHKTPVKKPSVAVTYTYVFGINGARDHSKERARIRSRTTEHVVKRIAYCLIWESKSNTRKKNRTTPKK